MIYNPLNDATQEIRLITILPARGDSEIQSQICCRVELVSLSSDNYTEAYRAYLQKADGFRETDVFSNSLIAEQESTSQGFQNWVETSASQDDATTHLPEFRYTWGDYMALSYTWGDPSSTREILLDGHSMRVTENIEACLRILRQKQYIRKGWKIWIDALCINQLDILERGNQVKRMREVYTNAWTPIVWLGDVGEDSDGAIGLIKLLAENYTMRDQVNVLTQTLYQDPEIFGVGRWRSLHQLATRRYWSRLWILQEAALSRKNTPVLCGNQTLPWIDVSRAFLLLSKTDEVINKFIVDELEAAALSFRISIWATFYIVSEIQLLQDVQLGHQRTNLYRLLNLGRTVFATDPRDKIYGFLNLMDDSLTNLISPDYSATVLDVYTDFALATIQATGSLDVIRHCFPTTKQEFPSWVPDWTVEPVTIALTISNTTFTTSGSSTADPQYLSDRKSLSCKGFKVDTFDGMGCMWSRYWSPDSIEQTIGSVNPYGSLEAVREAVWKSMVANRDIHNEPLNVDYSSLLATPILQEAHFADEDPINELIKSNIFDWCVRFLQGNAAFKVCGREIRDCFTDVILLPSIDRVHLRDALMRRDSINVRRRLVTTAKGYIGMVMETTQRDDVIYVMLGCSMPVILRPVEDGFQYVGECYIHGLMNGVAMQWLENNKCRLENIVLY